ncbi:hypothetical protein FO519_008247 [Halicephalobus sp. NKZ332]|nr:hypothetical protein FO519_008247 [Halicephalobus sp. NKZ332]
MTENQYFSSKVATIAINYSNVIGVITASVTPIYFYILLTQSSTLKKYKWFLLNHSFWCFCFLLSCVIVKPVLLLHAPCGFQVGIFRETSKDASVIALIVVFGLALMSVGGICMTLTYRYFGLFYGKIKTVCRSRSMYVLFVFLHLVFWIILLLCTLAIINIPQEVMIQQALQFDPELEPFTHEKTFMFIPEDIYNLAAIILLIAIICVLVVVTVFIYLIKKELMSKLRTEHQKNLIKSIIAQFIIAFVFQVCPFTFTFLSPPLKIPNSGPIMEIMEMLGVSYTLAEYCVTLYFVLPYRRYISKKLDAAKKTLKKIFPKKRAASTAAYIAINYANVIGAITVFIAPIHFYIILTQSEKLKTFKWFLLNHSFWCLCFLLSCVVFKPVLLLYAPCGFQTGIFRDTSMETTEYHQMTENQFFNLTVSGIFIIYTNIIVIVTVSIAPFYFYILFTQSLTLQKFKWFLLNHSFWCICFLTSFIIFKPVLLLYAPCGFLAGMLRETSMKSTVIALIVMFGLAIMSVGGVSMSLAYRYFGLFHGKIQKVCHSSGMYIFFAFLHLMLWVLLSLLTKTIMDIPQEVMIQQALEFSSDLELFTREKTFMFVSEDIYKVAAITAITCIIGLTIAFIVLIYLLKKDVIAQIAVTLVFEFCPFFYLFLSILFKIPNSGSIMEIMEMFAVSHTLIDYCITLYFVLPYRRYIKKKMKIAKNALNRLFRKGNVVMIQPSYNTVFSIYVDPQTSGPSRQTF